MEMDPGDPFFASYAKAVSLMHQRTDALSWENQARIHADHCHHGDVEFLHWHRHYLRFFEKICASLIGDPTFALPYWNWSKNSGKLPAPFFDLPELNVTHWNDPGQYSGNAWGDVDTIGVRALDKATGLLSDPTRGGAFQLSNINWIKGLATIDLFHPALENGPHGGAHVRVGATASGKNGHIYSGLSPLDPIFWLHHCMVDRVWAEWQKSGHATPDPGTDYGDSFFGPDGQPGKATSKEAMDTTRMGYTYDVLQTSAAPISALKSTDLKATAGPLSPQTLSALSDLLKPGPPEILGSSSNERVSVAQIATTIPVSIPSLTERANNELVLQNLDGLAPRYVARLTKVVQHEAANELLVNVFVECPYLSPETPYDDPHYAGTFAFFGSVQEMANMPDMQQKRVFVVDITGALQTLAREGRLKSNDLRIQLMPITAAQGTESKGAFEVQNIDVIRV